MNAPAKNEIRRVPLLVQLHRAIRWAAEQGIPVAPDAPGVLCVSRNPHRWERDPSMPAVCPLGALILQRQPPVSDVQRAEMLVLDDAPPSFVAGVESGLTRNVGSDAVFLKAATRRTYTEGIELGTWLRCELTAKACPLHGRFPANAVSCPACFDAEESV